MATVPYLYAISKTTQTITTADTPQKIDIDTQKLINGMSLSLAEDEVTIEEDGIYSVAIAAQVSRGNECETEVPNVRFFMKNNDTNIEDTNSLVNVNRHRETKAPYTKNFLLSLSAEDVLTFWASASVDDLIALEYIEESSEPDTPSFSIAITKLGEEGESECL